MSTGSPCSNPGDGTQQTVTNRPNLPTVAYRVDDFTGFRRALLRSLPGETALLGWRPAPGDLGLQMLEWWAYLADVLTFYNERIANESYLRTAQQPASVSGLVALLGYRPRPGIAATGQLAAVRRAARPLEPLVIPAGMRLASQATPGVAVQTFETSAGRSFNGASDARAIPPPNPDLLVDDTERRPSVLLAGPVSGVAVGDPLLLLPRAWVGGDEQWSWVTVAAVTPEPDPNGGSANTRVSFSSLVWGSRAPGSQRLTGQELGLPDRGGDELASAAAIGRVNASLAARGDAALGGHQSSGSSSAAARRPAGDYRLLRPAQSAALWCQTTDAFTTGAYPSLGVRLSAVVHGLAPDEVVLVADRSTGAVVLGRVSNVSEDLLTRPYPNPTNAKPQPPNIVIPHTVLTVTLPSKDDASYLAGMSATSTVIRFGFRDVGTPIATPARTLTETGVTMTVAAGFTVPFGGVDALLEDAAGAGIPVFAKQTSSTTVQLSALPATPATFSLQVPLRLFIDLIDVTRGTTVASELLGVGDATVANQSFTLAKSPLTYLTTGDSYASTLQVAVDGIDWTEVDTVYGQPPDARIFTVTPQSDGASVVRFGDGITGARLPSDSRVIATYRYGSGATSPPAGRLTTVLEPQANLAAVRNPVAVAGGADAEPADSIRGGAPASVLTFGRAISADDYEAIAARAPGVSRAKAYWSWDAEQQRTLVKVYVGDDPAAVELASAALTGAEDPNRPVTVTAATAVALTLSCTLVVAADRVPPDVVDAAKAAVGDPQTGLFSAQRMAIGAPLYSSQIEAALLVDGAVAVHDLNVVAGGAAVFSAPVWAALPGEGAFFTLALPASIPWAQADG